MDNEKEIRELSEDFQNCRKILTAIGDSNRQHLILNMMLAGDCNGVRVGDIAERTNLSRPAVSHHLQILKDAGLLCVRKEGTKNYYYFDSNLTSMKKLIGTLQKAIDIAAELPDREI